VQQAFIAGQFAGPEVAERLANITTRKLFLHGVRDPVGASRDTSAKIPQHNDAPYANLVLSIAYVENLVLRSTRISNHQRQRQSRHETNDRPPPATAIDELHGFAVQKRPYSVGVVMK
jgi:hypothetical protein